MGNEDSGDQELQSPPRNQGKSAGNSNLGKNISQESVVDNVAKGPNENEQPSGPSANDHDIAVTRMSVTTVKDETADINQPTHGVLSRETELEDLDNTSVQKTVLRRSTTGTSHNAAMLRVLSPRHRQQRSSGAERVSGPRPGNSSERFGVDSVIVPNGLPATPSQGVFLVQAHPVQPESASRSPLVEAKRLEDENCLIPCCSPETNLRWRILFVILCLALLVTGLVIGLDTDHASVSPQNAVSTDETSNVETFVKMLPEIVSPKSRAALLNPTFSSEPFGFVDKVPSHSRHDVHRTPEATICPCCSLLLHR